MRINFSGAPLPGRPFSERPMTFCRPEDVSTFAGILDLIAVETGERAPREHWQEKAGGLRHRPPNAPRGNGISTWQPPARAVRTNRIYSSDQREPY